MRLKTLRLTPPYLLPVLTKGSNARLGSSAYRYVGAEESGRQTHMSLNRSLLFLVIVTSEMGHLLDRPAAASRDYRSYLIRRVNHLQELGAH